MSDVIDVIYDHDCGFCTKTLRALGACDWARVLRLHASQDEAAVRARFPQLVDADFDAAMYTVSSKGVARGFFAFKEILRRVPLAWPLLVFFHLPGASVAGPRIYAWVASHRRQIGCDARPSGGSRR